VEHDYQQLDAPLNITCIRFVAELAASAIPGRPSSGGHVVSDRARVELQHSAHVVMAPVTCIVSWKYHLLHGSASNVVRTGRSVNGNRPKLTPS
jgi:hypothetical protein